MGPFALRKGLRDTNGGFATVRCIKKSCKFTFGIIFLPSNFWNCSSEHW